MLTHSTPLQLQLLTSERLLLPGVSPRPQLPRILQRKSWWLEPYRPLDSAALGPVPPPIGRGPCHVIGYKVECL